MTQIPVSTKLPFAPPPRLRFRAARAVVALILREMSTTYGRTPGGYIWAILQPVAMITLLTIVFSFLLRSPSLGTSFTLFYATGFLILRLFMEVSNSVGTALLFNQSLLAYPGVTFVDALASRAILAVLTQIMVSAIILSGVFIIDEVRVILNFGPIILAYAATIFLAAGVGAFNCYVGFAFPVYRTLWGIATRPLFLVSCVFYIYEDLPRTVQNILWFNPLTHLTGLVRTGFYSSYSPSYISLTFVCFLGAIPMVFGIMLLRRFSKDALYK